MFRDDEDYDPREEGEQGAGGAEHQGHAKQYSLRRKRPLAEAESGSDESDLEAFVCAQAKKRRVAPDDKSGTQAEPVVVDEESQGATDTDTNRAKLMSYEGVEVTVADLQRLWPGCLFNDVIIELEMKRIERQVLDPAERSKYLFFNPFFVKKLSLAPSTRFTSCGLDRWTRDVRVFDKQFLIVPVNEANHWVLVVVCLQGGVFEDVPGPVLLFFDSLGTCSIGKYGQRIRKWLNEEWERQQSAQDKETIVVVTEEEEDAERMGEARMRSTRARFNSESMPSHVLKNLPHQDNNQDCGVFMLHYVECFVRNRPRALKGFNDSWFDAAEIAAKREQIKDFIISHAGPMAEQAHRAWNTRPVPVTIADETSEEEHQAAPTPVVPTIATVPESDTEHALSQVAPPPQPLVPLESKHEQPVVQTIATATHQAVEIHVHVVQAETNQVAVMYRELTTVPMEVATTCKQAT